MFVEVFKKIDYNLNCIARYYEEMATFVPDYGLREGVTPNDRYIYR